MIGDKFLNEAKIGVDVEIVIGPIAITGKIISLDTLSVKIQKSDGKISTVALESIGYYEFSEDTSDTPNLFIQSQPKVISAQLQSKKDVFSVLLENGDTFFSKINPPKPKTYMEAALGDHELIAVTKSLDYSVKVGKETSITNFKVDENIRKIKRKIKSEKNVEQLYNMLGAIYYSFKHDRLALDSYLNGNDDETAFAVAESINSVNDMEKFACRHLIYNNGKLNPYILKWLLTRMIENDDFSIINEINSNETNSQRLQGYISFVKAALTSKGINYGSESSLDGLINVFKKSNVGSQSKMSAYISKTQIPKMPQKVTQPKNSVEVSIYMQARKARDELGDFDEAERLFLTSIHKGEKTSSAVADLINLMFQIHDFKKALKYLNEYKQYLDSTKYENIRTSIFKADPNLRYGTQTENTSAVSRQGFFDIAQRADIDEKDLPKAITYYKKAIESKEKLTASIPGLVGIYTRLKMYDEAIELLNNEGIRHMELEKYINLRMSVLSSAKEPKYKDDIKSTFNKAFDISKTGEKRGRILLSEAGLMYYIGEYETSADLFQQYKEGERYYLNPDSEKAKRQKIFALTGMCKTYSKLGDEKKVLGFANEILSLDSENEFAKSVISGEFNENLESEIIDDPYTENMTGVTQIPQNIIHRIESLTLENEIKRSRDLKDGKFIGTEHDASQIITSILKEQVRASVNDENQSNNYFTVAKLIRQVLDRDENITQTNIINEKTYQMNAAIGSYFYGNYRLFQTEFNRCFDTARYYLFSAISIFRDDSQARKCWAASTIRYIETFFCSNETIRDDTKIYYNLQNYENECKDKISEFMSKEITVPIEEFVSGMIEMLKYNSRIKRFFLQTVFNKTIKSKILDILGKIIDIKDDDITEEKFCKIWEEAEDRYYPKRTAFLQTISDTAKSVFTVGQLQENYDRFINCEFKSYLNQTDREYIESLSQIFSALLKYNEASEFDYKADNLVTADIILKKLEDRIYKNPTYISYEKLLPILKELTANIFKEAAQLYGNSHPEITVKLSGDCPVDEENLIVRAPIAFINKNNVQNADNVSIKIEGENITVIDDGQLSRGLLKGNGQATEKMVKFRVTPKIIESKVCTLNIIITYQYKKNMTEFENADIMSQLSVPLYSSSIFEPIENKFKPYRNGSAVKEPSMFFGRYKDIEHIIKQISDGSGNVLKGKCLALYGQTRTGKSSLLYHLERRLREIDQENNVIINVGSIGEENLLGNDITGFLYTVLSELRREIQNRHPKLNEIISKNEIKIDPDEILDDPEHSQLHFSNVFKDINRCLENDDYKDYKYNFIVMIDEFTYIYDWIRSEKMTDAFTKFWKAFIQNNGVFGIIIGQDHMMKFVNDIRFTNDLGAVDLIKVTYLSEEDAKKLMYEPIMLVNENGEKVSRYQPEALNRLYELTAGSAFLIMILCAELVEYLNATRSVYITRAHVDECIREKLTSFEEKRLFEPLFNDKSKVDNEKIIEENKRILYEIAKISNKREWASLKSIIKTEDDKKIIEDLEQRDVLIIQNNERCKIKVALYKEWIIARNGWR